VQQVNAFIIAGGKSSRMKQGPEMPSSSKAFLSVDGRFLIEHAIQQARVADDIYIVGPKDKFSAYGRVVLDIFPDAGPLGGIHAALKRTRAELNLILPVDMPFLKRDFLVCMLETALKNTALVTVPRMNGRLQPLCAVYRKGFVEAAETALNEGKHKVDVLFVPATTAYIDVDTPEMRQLGFETGMFDNINSPDDYERAAKRKVPWTKTKRAHE
jgi:molybdopterin-guanine dinucleotide biosynthesis protein A